MARRVIRREAHAKINVFLRVLGRRNDGYHELESLVLPITLADRVSVRQGPSLEVRVRGSRELTEGVPAGGLNLALVAALALADTCPGAGGADIEVNKRIPVAGGLGGGSADAAATLLALNELWGCGLDAETLAEIGARVGSDVPAMMAGGPVVMRGCGEVLEPARAGPLWWVIVPLSFGVRSPDAYAWWDQDGGLTGPDPEEVLSAAAAGDPEALGPLLYNDLEGPVSARHPQIGETRRSLLEAGVVGAIMAGSGSTMAGLAEGQEHARELGGVFPEAVVAAGPP